MNKPVKVSLIGQAKSEYERLTQTAEQQAKKGKKNSEEIQILKAIEQKKEFIRQDPHYGNPIAKKKIPAILNVQNLWRIELPHYWRMVYTIKGDQIEIVCFGIFIGSHKDYDKIFGY